MQEEKEIQYEIAQFMGQNSWQTISFTSFRMALSAHLNYLIMNDFSMLLAILYRIDIDEKKLKTCLRQHRDEDAGYLIADMLIERQLQKILTRARFRAQQSDIPDSDKW